MSPRQGILRIYHMPVNLATGLATRPHSYRPSTKKLHAEDLDAVASPVVRQYLPINGL